MGQGRGVVSQRSMRSTAYFVTPVEQRGAERRGAEQSRAEQSRAEHCRAEQRSMAHSARRTARSAQRRRTVLCRTVPYRTVPSSTVQSSAVQYGSVMLMMYVAHAGFCRVSGAARDTIPGEEQGLDCHPPSREAEPAETEEPPVAPEEIPALEQQAPRSPARAGSRERAAADPSTVAAREPRRFRADSPLRPAGVPRKPPAPG